MNRALTSRFARAGHARQLEAARATDRIGAEVDRAARMAWQAILHILGTRQDAWSAATAVQDVALELLPAIHGEVIDGLANLAGRSHDHTAQALMQSLPTNYLLAAIGRTHGEPSRSVREGRNLPADPDRGGRCGRAGHARATVGGHDCCGAHRGAGAGRGGQQPARQPLQEAGSGFVTFDPFGAEPAEELIRRLLFPPLDRLHAFRIVRNIQIGGQSWEQRLNGYVSTRFSPSILAGIISLGYSQGKDQKQIARDLLPAMDGLRVNARRLARTYGMAIAHHTQMRTVGQLGDLVIGYQVHATLDQWTRPEHRARDGTVYYKRPAAGQHGVSQMPHPPLEADGRPAWN